MALGKYWLVLKVIMNTMGRNFILNLKSLKGCPRPSLFHCLKQRPALVKSSLQKAIKIIL